MERPRPGIRLLGPFERQDFVRPIAERTADIQTAAWVNWLAEKGVSQEIIESTLWSDSQNRVHMQARETRLREAFGRTSDNEAVLYFGAFATNGDMVGFSKFLLSEENNQLIILLAEIDVLPEYQGKQAENSEDHNLAKKMMYSAVANVQNENTILRLQVLADNDRARALYERLGFRVTDTSGTFAFDDNGGHVVHEEPHWDMEASAVTIRDNLRHELDL